MDEVGRLAVAACKLAIQDAAVPTGSDDVGVALGTATAGIHSTLEHLQALSTTGPGTVPALSFSNTVGNAAASLCAIEFGLRGPNVTLSQKHASSLASFVHALRSLERGRGRAFVTGGADDFGEKFFRVHDRLRVLARAGDACDEACRPFDRRRNGMVLGTGAFVIVLETEASARERQATIRADVLGAAAGASPCELNAWPRDGAGMARVVRAALDDAGVRPSEVGTVFSAANSSGLDLVEAEAIEAVFGPFGVPVVAVKAAIGELAASAAGSVVAACEAASRGVVPPTHGTEELDPACHVDVSATSRPARSPIALITATASGGAHYAVVIRAAVG